MGIPFKREHISDMQDISCSSSHRSINIHSHLFICEQNSIDVEFITATTLLSSSDFIECNHTYVRALILLLLEFATEWKQGLDDILK